MGRLTFLLAQTASDVLSFEDMERGFVSDLIPLLRYLAIAGVLAGVMASGAFFMLNRPAVAVSVFLFTAIAGTLAIWVLS